MPKPLNATATAALLNCPFSYYPQANFGALVNLIGGTDKQRVDTAITLMRQHPDMRQELSKYINAMDLSAQALAYCEAHHIQVQVAP